MAPSTTQPVFGSADCAIQSLDRPSLNQGAQKTATWDGKIQHMRNHLLIRSGVLRWGPAALLMAVIFFLSSIPSQGMPVFGRYDFLVKKLGHFTGYALLAQSFLRGLGRNDQKTIGFAWILAVLYGASDELHQAFVPGRQSTLIDVGIDALGALTGLFPSLVRRLRSAR